jgi:hypothetical protein
MLFSKQLKNPIKNNKMLEDEKKTFKKGKKKQENPCQLCKSELIS